MVISAGLQLELRQQVLQDVLQLHQQGVNLSANWFRQLGIQDLANQVEAGLVTQQQRRR